MIYGMHDWTTRTLIVLLFLALLCPPIIAPMSLTAQDAAADFALSQLVSPSVIDGQPPAYQEHVTWNLWNPAAYTLAADGDYIWIGGEGGLIRFDTRDASYRRITRVDGLPHFIVYTIALDAAGNRWFGGDGGLSRLDSAGQWRHFDSTSSGLATDRVDGIALAADGTLWLSHGLPDGAVSRRTSDGAWETYADRLAAVDEDYELILQTTGASPLWTVAGASVWVGFSEYDGAEWIDRTPDSARSPAYRVVADSQGVVYVLALDSAAQEWPDTAPDRYADLLQWNGKSWRQLYMDYNFGTLYNSIVVDDTDTVWVGMEYRGWPYSAKTAMLSKIVTDEYGDPVVDHNDLIDIHPAGPVFDMVISDDALWAVGASWLLHVEGMGGTVHSFADVPNYADVTSAFVVDDTQLWLHSDHDTPFCYTYGKVQQLADQGTDTLDDDKWQVMGWTPVLDTYAVTPAGDVWTSTSICWRFFSVGPTYRYHAGGPTEYTFPPDDRRLRINDIYVPDERQTWFTRSGCGGWGLGSTPPRILHLDDGGTAGDLTDDSWETYAPDSSGCGGSAVVDAVGTLWYGDSAGLYRYDDDAWSQVEIDGFDPQPRIERLIPAADGALLALYRQNAGGDACSTGSERVLVVWPDGDTETLTVAALAEHHLATLHTATRDNPYWTVAADGAVWYRQDICYGADGPAPVSRAELRSARDDGEMVYRLPFKAADVEQIAVDGRNHLWLVAHGRLWRMTLTPAFVLGLVPDRLLVEAGNQGSAVLAVQGIHGFERPVTLKPGAQPSGITATLAQNLLKPGEESRLTVTVDSSVLPGAYGVTLIGAADGITQTVPVTVTVATKLSHAYLPQVRR